MNDKQEILEQNRRLKLMKHAIGMAFTTLPIEDHDEDSIMLLYQEFYLQISFSELHPLMVIYLARTTSKRNERGTLDCLNQLNLKNILGSHAINSEIGCYTFKATHWLDSLITAERLLEILDRCRHEAGSGYATLNEK